MLNHFHIVAQGEGLSSKMKNLKSYTATEIIKLLKKKKKAHILDQLSEAKPEYKIESEHQVWQEGFHPKQIIGDKMMIQKNRIHS